MDTLFVIIRALRGICNIISFYEHVNFPEYQTRLLKTRSDATLIRQNLLKRFQTRFRPFDVRRMRGTIWFNPHRGNTGVSRLQTRNT